VKDHDSESWLPGVGDRGDFLSPQAGQTKLSRGQSETAQAGPAPEDASIPNRPTTWIELAVGREPTTCCGGRSAPSACARAEALELSREGRYKNAGAILEKTTRRVDGYGGADTELKAVTESLRAEGADSGHVMDQNVMKQSYCPSCSISKNRMAGGKARR
jgi:hypothetical protein